MCFVKIISILFLHELMINMKPVCNFCCSSIDLATVSEVFMTHWPMLRDTQRIQIGHTDISAAFMTTCVENEGHEAAHQGHCAV